MTRWGFIRVLALVAAGFTAFSAVIGALVGDTTTALLFGVLTVMNIAQYMNARQYL